MESKSSEGKPNTSETKSPSNSSPNHTNITMQVPAGSRKTSVFWLKSKNLHIKLDVLHNSREHLHHLFKTFTKSTFQTGESHFGIDNLQLKINPVSGEFCCLREIPKSKLFSKYWFSSGSFFIIFPGKPMSTKKILTLFAYIKSRINETSDLEFGVDHLVFSYDLYNSMDLSESSSLDVSNDSICLESDSSQVEETEEIDENVSIHLPLSFYTNSHLEPNQILRNRSSTPLPLYASTESIDLLYE